jgi:hypothetical protein
MAAPLRRGRRRGVLWAPRTIYQRTVHYFARKGGGEGGIGLYVRVCGIAEYPISK